MIFLLILTAFSTNAFAKSLPNQQGKTDVVDFGIPAKLDSAKVIFIPDFDVQTEDDEKVGAVMEEMNSDRNKKFGQNTLDGFLRKPSSSAADREQVIIISREPITHVSETMQENDGSRTFSNLNRGNGRGLGSGNRGISGIISSLQNLQNLQNIMNNPQGQSQNLPSRGVSVLPSTISGLNQGSGLIDNSNIPQRVVITTSPGFSTFGRPLQNWQQGSVSSFGGSLFNQGNFLDTDPNTPIENVDVDLDLDLESLITTAFRQNLPLEKPPKVLNPDVVTLPYLFQFPEYRRSMNDDRWHSTRSSNVQNKHSVNKRSLPIVKLIHNPNVKLDFPKTIQNLGSAARNSFEDENAPMHHMNNLIGSVKNVFLSTLKIPPQDLIIPSQYKIVNSDDVHKLRMNPTIESDHQISNRYNSSDPYDIISTFQKVGVVLRDSIHSTQETFGHAGDIAHSARKIIHTSRHSTPRLIIPYAKAPAIVPRVSSPPPPKPRDDRVLLIAPKILGVSRDSTKKPPNSFVRVGQIMDALGMSNPNKRKFDTEEIIIQPKKPVKTNLRDKRPRTSNLLKSKNKSYTISTRSGFEDDDEVLKAINTLEAAEDKNGVGNLKELITKMKGDLNLLKTKLTERKNSKKGIVEPKKSTEDTKKGIIDTQKATDKEIDAEITHLVKNILEDPPKSDNCTKNTTTQQGDVDNKEDDEIVGAGLPLAANLLKPFMGRPSRRQIVQFLKENGNEIDPDEDDDEIVGDAEQEQPPEPIPDVDQILGAVNPVLFQKFLNDSIDKASNNTKADDEADNILGKIPGEKVKITMDIEKNLLKPFIDKPTKEDVNNYLEYYKSKFEDAGKIDNKDNELS